MCLLYECSPLLYMFDENTIVKCHVGHHKYCANIRFVDILIIYSIIFSALSYLLIIIIIALEIRKLTII